MSLFNYSNDCLRIILSYLKPKECSTLCMLNKVIQENIQAFVWKYLTDKLMIRLGLQNRCTPLVCTSRFFQEQYLYYKHLETYAELVYWINISPLLQKVQYLQRKSNKILGIVGNFLKLKSDNTAIAIAISYKCKSSFCSVITKTIEDARSLREKFQDQRVTFLSLKQILSLKPVSTEFSLHLKQHKGFIGYAIDLIETEPEIEYLRIGLSLTIFSNLSVWQSEADIKAAQLPDNQYTVALDQVKFDHGWYLRSQLIMKRPTRLPCFFSSSTSRFSLARNLSVDKIIVRFDNQVKSLQNALNFLKENEKKRNSKCASRGKVFKNIQCGHNDAFVIDILKLNT